MILTREEILRHPKIVIEPRNEELISINSVDVRLGPDMWRFQTDKPRRYPFTFYNRNQYRDLYVPEDRLLQRCSTVKASQVRERYVNWAKGVVPDDANCFILKSGKFYLATTLEKIGALPPEPGHNSIVPEMKAKSTVGRQGLTVALCAGLGDVGFKSKWLLEVRVTDDGDVPIAIGTPIAQVVFHLATPTEACYDGPSRYQDGDQVRFLPKPLRFMEA